MKVEINATTDGKSVGTEESRVVLISRLDFGWKSTDLFPEDTFKGELRAYFEPTGFTNGSWNVEAYGTICPDRLWIREFKVGMREIGFTTRAVRDLKYNDLVMQCNDYVSFEIGPVFYDCWNKLVEKGKLVNE